MGKVKIREKQYEQKDLLLNYVLPLYIMHLT